MAKTGTDTVKKIGGCKPMRCNCASEFQDKTYGPGNRVHNMGKEKWTCTVCGNKK